MERQVLSFLAVATITILVAFTSCDKSETLVDAQVKKVVSFTQANLTPDDVITALDAADIGDKPRLRQAAGRCASAG